ncbi:MAG: rod shape-determining protein RodA [Saprospiraceae bacterium]
MRDRNAARGIDGLTFGLFLSLVVIGWLAIYTVGYGDGYPDSFGDYLNTASGKQTIWIGISLFVFGIIYLIDWKFWRTFAYPIYGFALLLLILVLIFGSTIKGATSWFSFGGFSLQPSEFAKFATCLAMASYLSTYNTDLRNLYDQAIGVTIFSLPIVLILLQPDAGSALVFLSFLLVLYRAGLSSVYFLIGGTLTLLLILGIMYEAWITILGLLWLGILVLNIRYKNHRLQRYTVFGLLVALSVLAVQRGWIIETLGVNAAVLLIIGLSQYGKKSQLVNITVASLAAGSTIVYAANYAFNNFLGSHQQDRINVWLRPELCDPRGSLYNVLQSKMAIGSGGLHGKGFLQGTMTKLNYVPEQTTDFIFCTIGEEQGFIGSTLIILVFCALMLRIVFLAEKQRSLFSRYYAYGVAGILFIHILINIGMTIGLMPIIGIPLPFISKGGSSLLGFTIMMAVLIKLDSYRFSS